MWSLTSTAGSGTACAGHSLFLHRVGIAMGCIARPHSLNRRGFGICACSYTSQCCYTSHPHIQLPAQTNVGHWFEPLVFVTQATPMWTCLCSCWCSVLVHDEDIHLKEDISTTRRLPFSWVLPTKSILAATMGATMLQCAMVSSRTCSCDDVG